MATVLQEPPLAAASTPAPGEMTWHTIGGGFPGHRFHGCRLGHVAQLGMVGFRLHGGAAPMRPSRDEPVQFLLDGNEIDDLIGVLTDIRRDLGGGVIMASAPGRSRRSREWPSRAAGAADSSRRGSSTNREAADHG